MQHEPGDGHAVGAGVDRVDRGAVGSLQHDVLDVDVLGSRAQLSHLDVPLQDRGLGETGQAVLDRAGARLADALDLGRGRRDRLA